MTETDRALQELSMGVLAVRCERETAAYYRGDDYDPRFCFELFRRAAQEDDQRAWELLYRQYHAQVHAWVVRQSTFGGVAEEPAHYVNLALERLWKRLRDDRFTDFPDLASVLNYLKRCVITALIDDVRRRQLDEVGLEQAYGEPMQHQSNPEDLVRTKLERQALWEYVRSCAKDEAESIVVHESFVLALKPGEICSRHEELFDSVDEVYRVKQNLMNRFRRDEQIRQWL